MSFPQVAIDIARIFHTDRNEEAAKADVDTTGGRESAVETAFMQP